ncbi:hypothetical protein [Microvirga lenta]|uniref:hypothetical protein n=1 Tax=Microvirga lenta TaxID=2881337 RepID=UPI001CFFDAF3|nr:hypothetical protein [Microvirga lenta]MCB5177745.1 hypothetical protein [Microvirga lenta]
MNDVQAGRTYLPSNRDSFLLTLSLFVLPNCFLFAGYFQLFPPAGWVDPGMYLGYFLDLPGKIREFGPNYHAMRLPFTGVGYILHLIFSGDVANYARIILFNTLALVSIYALVFPRHGFWAAILTAWWLALNPLWIAAIARTYADGPAIAYMLCALACWVNRDFVPRRGVAAWLSGFLGAVAVFCHQVSLLILGGAAVAATLAYGATWRQFLQDSAWATAGGLTAAVLLGGMSLMLGGNLLFFLSDTNAITRSFAGFGANYQLPLLDWLRGAYRLLAAFMVGILGLGVLYAKGAHHSRTLIFGLAQLTATGLLFFVWDFGVGGAMTQSIFYSSYFLLGETLLVAGLFGLTLPNTKGANSWAILLSFAGLFALASTIILAAPRLWQLLEALPGARIPWAIVALIFGLSLVFLYWKQRSGFVAVLVGATVLCGALDQTARSLFLRKGALNNKATYRTTLLVHSTLRTSVPGDRKLLFWYDRDELSALEMQRATPALYTLRFGDIHYELNLWDSVSALWQWDRGSLGWDMPNIPDWGRSNLHFAGKPVSIVMFCIQKSRCSLAQNRLREMGYVTQERLRTTIVGGGYFPFRMVVFDVKQPPSLDTSGNS